MAGAPPTAVGLYLGDPFEDGGGGKILSKGQQHLAGPRRQPGIGEFDVFGTARGYGGHPGLFFLMT